MQRTVPEMAISSEAGDYEPERVEVEPNPGLGIVTVRNTASEDEVQFDAETWQAFVSSLPGRKRLYGLTADEWFALACVGQDSEVGPCCGDIGQLREALQWMATSHGEGEDWLPRRSVREAYESALAGHDTLASSETFPLLHRVLDGIKEAGV